jgi:Spy/CpxP family protein refolding chaperone
MTVNRTCLWILALLLVVPILPGAATAAAYQGGGYGGGGGRGGPVSPDEQVKRMSKALDLTAEQQSKLKPILVDQRKKMDDVRNDSSLDRRAMRDKMMQIRQDANDQVRALLNDKQKEKFDKMEQEREDRMQNRRGGGPGWDNSGGNPPAPPPQN